MKNIEFNVPQSQETLRSGELESSETKNITSTVNDLAFPKYINVIQIIPPLN